jgi:hypothetical protein
LASQLPASARQPGGGAGLRAIDPAKLAERIVRSCLRRDAELVLPGKVRWLAALAQLFPRWADRLILRRVNSKAES